MSRAITEREARTRFLKCIHDICDEWARFPDKTPLERCEGTAFSILVMFDGESADFPAMDISLSPHPDDKEYHKSLHEDWYEDCMIINDCDYELHHMFINREYK